MPGSLTLAISNSRRTDVIDSGGFSLTPRRCLAFAGDRGAYLAQPTECRGPEVRLVPVCKNLCNNEPISARALTNRKNSQIWAICLGKLGEI
jgi:hypothetical protein